MQETWFMFYLDTEEGEMRSTIVSQIPQHISHSIVPAVILSPPHDSLLCMPYSKIVFILSESPPTPQVQKCTSWRFVPALKSGECLYF